MRKKDLADYRDLVREADECESELKILKKRMGDEPALKRKILPLQQKTLRLKKKALEKTDEVEKFIEKCPEPYLRQILFLRYVRGFTWEKVAFKAGGRNKSDTVRKMAERYILKSEKR